MKKPASILAVTAFVLMAAPAIADDASQSGDAQEQSWNWHAQNTIIYQGDPGFSAAYSGPHSLISGGEAKETISADLTVGARLWDGGELHADFLLWQGFGLSHTLGILAFPNAESFKAGTDDPNYMFSRLFLRQTIGFGGEQEDVPDDQLTLAGKRDISRLTFTIGRMSFTDQFDHNSYAGDSRNQFMNWAMVTNLAWDYGQDTIGYSLGATVELNQQDWTLRYGYFEMPQYVNAGNFGSGNGGEDEFLVWPARGHFAPIFKSYAMAAEFEQRYSMNSHPGAIRFLTWLNHANIDDYQDATAILLAEGPNADISPAQTYHYAFGFGLNWEQEVTEDIGVFSRLGWSDGQTQALEYSDADWTASLGLSVKGGAWNRPDDTIGFATVVSGLSQHSQQFLNAGGLGIEVGDGALNYGAETALESYYSLQLWTGIAGTFDYQFIANPGANRDRGPVSIFGIRLHAQL